MTAHPFCHFLSCTSAHPHLPAPTAHLRPPPPPPSFAPPRPDILPVPFPTQGPPARSSSPSLLAAEKNGDAPFPSPPGDDSFLPPGGDRAPDLELDRLLAEIADTSSSRFGEDDGGGWRGEVGGDVGTDRRISRQGGGQGGGRGGDQVCPTVWHARWRTLAPRASDGIQKVDFLSTTGARVRNAKQQSTERSPRVSPKSRHSLARW